MGPKECLTPILTQKKKLPTIMRSIGAEGVIIADKSLSKEGVLVIVEQCLEFNYKVYIVPLITDWENQKRFQKVKKLQIEDLLERKPIVLDSKSISKQLKDKTILVTGAGSIGSEIVRRYCFFSPKIIVLDQAETLTSFIFLELNASEIKTKMKFVVADIRNLSNGSCF
jgi:FlaA1/EpsC-like NDP-sugar epimerase